MMYHRLWENGSLEQRLACSSIKNKGWRWAPNVIGTLSPSQGAGSQLVVKIDGKYGHLRIFMPSVCSKFFMFKKTLVKKNPDRHPGHAVEEILCITSRVYFRREGDPRKGPRGFRNLSVKKGFLLSAGVVNSRHHDAVVKSMRRQAAEILLFHQ